MTETFPIDLDNRKIEYSFENPGNVLHPAIGAVDGQAYVVVHLPAEIRKEKASSKTDLPFVITNKRGVILADNEVLSNHNWRLLDQPLNDNRWSLDSVKRYVQDGATVTPSLLYARILEAWTDHIEFDDLRLYHLLTLWTIGTFFYHLFQVYPYIYIGGLKRTGKTKVLTVASLICLNAYFTMNISIASLFRLNEAKRATGLIDESEHLSQPQRFEGLSSLLNSGYKKGGKVFRTEKINEVFVVKAYDAFSPKMLANIGGLGHVLADRTITIIMQRGLNPAILNREVKENEPRWQEIRDDLHILYLQYFDQILTEYNAVSVVSDVSDYPIAGKEKELIGRSLELWRPILALASFFDKQGVSIPDIPTSQTTQTSLTSLMGRLALEVTEQGEADEMADNLDYILAETLTQLVKESGYISGRDILLAMNTKIEYEATWLNSKWIGRALKRLGFRQKRKLSSGREYFFDKAQIERLVQRLGLVKKEDPPKTREDPIPTDKELAGVRGIVPIQKVLEGEQYQ